jgi:hypothetical protein
VEKSGGVLDGVTFDLLRSKGPHPAENHEITEERSQEIGPRRQEGAGMQPAYDWWNLLETERPLERTRWRRPRGGEIYQIAGQAMKKNRIANIATYKTRAEIIRENPIRAGDDEILDSNQVCAVLKISSSTLGRYRRNKSIRFTMLSQTNYRYRKSDIEAFMASRQIDQRKVDRRIDQIESPIQRRTGDRRRADRVQL